MESNDYKSENMMHSIKSMENWDLECDDKMGMKKEKKQDKDKDKSCDKNYEKEYGKNYGKDCDKKYDQNYGKECDKKYDKDYDKEYDKKYDKNYGKECDKKYDKNYEKECDKKYDKNYEKECDKKYDKNYDKEYDKKYDKNYDKECDKKYDKNYGKECDQKYDKKSDKKEQEFGWDTDWSAIMNKKGIESSKQCESKEYKKNEKAKMCCNNMKGNMYDMKHEDKETCNMVMCMPMMHCDMKEHKCITIGDKMPHMKVKTTMGMKKLPDDYLGKWLVLFSHPGDFTPVCTTEFVSFAKNYDNFKQLDTELLGLSVDQVQPHIKWTRWIEEKLCTPIPFPIIADPMGTVANELGMIHSAKSSQTVRAVFIVDPTGTIRMILYYPGEVGRNIEEIIRALAALQVADKHNVAMPANWPSNELIGDQVIIPPAATEEEAKKNEKNYCNYDWWFCYKALE